MERSERYRRILNAARGAAFAWGLYDLYSSMQKQDEVALNNHDITVIFSSEDNQEMGAGRAM